MKFEMPKGRNQIDAVLGKSDFVRLLLDRLRVLKSRIIKARILEEQEILRSSRRVMFRLGLVLPKDWYKSLATFTVLSLLLMTFLGSLRLVNSGQRLSRQILGTATQGFEFLQSGQAVSAIESFAKAQAQIKNSNELLLKILTDLPLGLPAQELLQASDKIVSALQETTKGFREFSGSRIVWDASANTSDQQFYLSLKTGRAYFLKAAEDLGKANAALGSLNTAFLPGALEEQFLRVREELAAAQEILNQIVSFQGTLLKLLGGEKKTYLLIFQNNNEARATGGFIGTYGLLEFGNGIMRIERIESIYALDGQLTELIAAPGPLQRQVSPYWGMRDSNWFVDFPKTSRKILEFLEKEGKILADGVISFTPDVFENFLELTGPVEMPEYGATLTADNFRETVQQKTSLDYDRELNQPKKFLANFAPRFLTKLRDLEEGQWLSFLNIIFEMIYEKHVLLFSLDLDIQKENKNYRADGGIYATTGDYLAIYHSNVGGGKTDRHIPQRVEKHVSFDSGGLAIVRLSIQRTHQGFDEKFFPKNLDYLRILVPREAQLLSASGFDDYELLKSSFEGAITDPDLAAWDQGIARDEKTGMYIAKESGYTVFSNWLELLPGETKTVKLTYEVPFGSAQSYTQVLQKQPGSIPFEFNLTVNYFPGNIAFYYPENFTVEGNELRISEIVRGDRFYGVVGK